MKKLFILSVALAALSACDAPVPPAPVEADNPPAEPNPKADECPRADGNPCL